MSDFVLDNSVTMRWCFDSGSHVQADAILRILETGQGEAFVPRLWRYEVSAVLARAQKTGVLTAERVTEFLDDLDALPIRMDAVSIHHALSETHRLAVLYNLTSYDAAYLEVALRRHLPLATLDAD